MKAIIVLLVLSLFLISCGGGDSQTSTPPESGADQESGATVCNINNYRDYINKPGNHKCNLSGADLSGVDLSNANLSGADLSGADLTGANMTGADVTGAKFLGAKVDQGVADYLKSKKIIGFRIVK